MAATLRDVHRCSDITEGLMALDDAEGFAATTAHIQALTAELPAEHRPTAQHLVGETRECVASRGPRP